MIIYSKQLLYKPLGNSYEEGEVIISSSTGGDSGTIEVLCDGIYKLAIVGGGSGGYYSESKSSPNPFYIQFCNGGGGGSAFVGNIILKAGTYSYSIGAGGKTTSTVGGNSIFGTCQAFGGSTSSIGSTTTAYISGGAIPTIPYTKVSTIINSAGNEGQSNVGGGPVVRTLNSAGGASLYNGFGAGASLRNGTATSAATSGCVHLEFVSKE